MKKPRLSAISLFAGCGGSDLGLRLAGVETIWANEVSEPACEIFGRITRLKTMHPGDIRRFRRFPRADILAGCYPCQGYSPGGRREDSDGINYLYQEFDRVLRCVRPLAFVVENVDGMRFSQNHHLLVNQVTRFRLAGYRVRWKVLDAKDYGLAQDRKRLFVVGIRSSEGLAYAFPDSTHGIKRKPHRTLRDVIWDMRKAPEGSYDPEPLHWYYLSRNRRRTWCRQAPCIVAHWRHVPLHPDSPPLKKVGPDHWEFTRSGRARRYSYLECAALQGFPDPEAFDVCSVRQRFRAIGNAVPPPLFGAVAQALVNQLENR